MPFVMLGVGTIFIVLICLKVKLVTSSFNVFPIYERCSRIDAMIKYELFTTLEWSICLIVICVTLLT